MKASSIALPLGSYVGHTYPICCELPMVSSPESGGGGGWLVLVWRTPTSPVVDWLVWVGGCKKKAKVVVLGTCQEVCLSVCRAWLAGRLVRCSGSRRVLAPI